MRKRIINLVLILFLAVAAVGILLLLDRRNRSYSYNYSLALVQSDDSRSSQEMLRGFEAGLKERGLFVNRNLNLFRTVIRHDYPSAPDTMDMKSRFDLVVTTGTEATENMMARSLNEPVPLFFGIVEKPLSVPTSGKRKEQRPIRGFTSLFAVREMIEQIHSCNPEAASFGVIARDGELSPREEAPRDLRVSFVTVKDDEEAIPAVQQMIENHVNAIIVLSGKNVFHGFRTMAEIAVRAGIPIFARTEQELEDGALGCLENDYYTGGKVLGLVAGEILVGTGLKEFSDRNVLPLKLLLNETVSRKLGSAWHFSPAVLARAEMILGPTGIRRQNLARQLPEKRFYPILQRTPTRRPNLLFVNYNEATSVEENMNGFLAGMERAGYKLGEHYDLRIVNVNENQTEAVNLFRSIPNMGIDLVLITTTTLLENGIKLIRDKPVVFAVVADPIAAGAGKSLSDHLPNVTGVSSMPNFAGMAALLRECLPEVDRVGTLYNPGERNSVIYRDLLAVSLKAEGIELVSIPNFSADGVSEAAGKLAHSDIDAFCQISDNLHNRSFSVISNVAMQSHLPVFSFVKTNAVQHGAAIALAYDYEEGGREQAALAIRILKDGESPRNIPIIQTRKMFIVVNMINAQRCGLKVPPSILERAEMVVE